MGLTVKETLSIKNLEGIRIVAGEQNLDNVIRWVHIGEKLYIADWLKGGELLLTCAHGIKDDKTKQEYLIKELFAKDVSALAIEPGYYFESIPQNMIDLANKIGLPLLEIKPGMPFIKITEKLMKKIVKLTSFEKLLEDNQIYGLESKNGPNSISPFNKEQELIEKVKYGKKEDCFDILKRMFCNMANNKCEEEFIQIRCLEISAMLSRAAVKTGVDHQKVFKLNLNYNKEVNDVCNIEEHFNLSKQLIKSYINLIHKNKKKKNLELVKRAKNYIKENYAKKLTLDQIADQIYLSSSHLSKKFKKSTGMTVIEYVNKIRLKEAKKLLKTTNLPLNKIAEKTGYYDASYFSKVFKKKVGITPGQYRTNTKK
mgnify:CR=1 FL=1